MKLRADQQVGARVKITQGKHVYHEYDLKLFSILSPCWFSVIQTSWVYFSGSLNERDTRLLSICTERQTRGFLLSVMDFKTYFAVGR